MGKARWVPLGAAMVLAAVVAAVGGRSAAPAAATVGTSFPAGFPTIVDASLGTPVLGFGAAGRVKRTPVIFLHGNNDTPFPTACNAAGKIHDLAQAFVDRGYSPSEVWGLGYQGDQCDLAASPTNRSADSAHDGGERGRPGALREAVLDYTGAKRVDIVGHSLGGTLAREWMRRDHAYQRVRHLVTIASPHHGIIDCSPSPLNYFALDALGGFNPNSAICVELGAADTPFLTRLNREETPGPTKYLALRNADADFVYISAPDGPFFPAVPAQDRNGNPHDFSASPALAGKRATNVALTGQGAYDAFGAAHLGILAVAADGAARVRLRRARRRRRLTRWRAPRTPSAAPARFPLVHLRSLRLRGFKSFPDTLELKLEPGVAVVVGPNGSGKSNVADAIVWAAGSLTPSELRAEKPDDVLFNGAEGRTPAESCEVELVFDNESGGFGELDFSEVSIARRLHRGGEGQYLVNKAQVRRTDLVELLADVGLGGSMHSIVSQGKVEAVLASKPEERRELVEEAAGLGKFKRRRHRAELKLARVGIQVERAKDVEAEVRKRLRPLALQATAAERAEKLVDEIAGLRARIAQLDLEAADARREAAEERKTAAGIGRRSAQEKLQALLTERQAAEEELADAAGRREAAIKALYRLQGATERIALRQEGAQELLERLRADLGDAEAAATAPTDASTLALEQAAAEATAAARAAAAASGAGAERARAAQERLASLERGAAAVAEERLDALRAERQGIESELADAAGGREGATVRALPARHGARADRDAGRVRVEPARALPGRAGRGRGGGEAPRPVAGRARGRRERGDRGCPRRRARTRRPRRARGAGEGPARGARALARRARRDPARRTGVRGRGSDARAVPPRRRARQRASRRRSARVARVRSRRGRSRRRPGAAAAGARRGPRQPGRARRDVSVRPRRRAAGRRASTRCSPRASRR